METNEVFQTCDRLIKDCEWPNKQCLNLWILQFRKQKSTIIAFKRPERANQGKLVNETFEACC